MTATEWRNPTPNSYLQVRRMAFIPVSSTRLYYTISNIHIIRRFDHHENSV